MPQSKEQRRYWAEKRKNDERAGFKSIYYKGKEVKPNRSTKTETVLLAKDEKEYDEMRRDYPHLKVSIMRPMRIQTDLFDAREYRDV